MKRRAFLFGPLAGLAAQGTPVTAEVRSHLGRPTIFLNGRPEAPVLYALGHCTGYRRTTEEQPQYSITQFHRLGFRLFQADLWLEEMWTGPKRFDIAAARRQIRGVLAAAPGAAVMLRLHVNSPPWWNEANPDELVQYANAPLHEEPAFGFRVFLDDDLKRMPRHSMASKKWLREAGEMTALFCRQLAGTAEGRAVFALQLSAGVYGEWHYYGFQANEPDTGPAMTARFREFTGDATARVPSREEREQLHQGIFRHPVRHKAVVDYYRCQHEAVTEAFLHFCRIVKKNWPRPVLTGGFHGYWFTMFGRMAAGGHLELRRALESAEVDFLAAPQSYKHLKYGDAGLSRGLPDLARLYGKLWLDEMDTPPAIWDQKRTDRQNLLPESLAVLRRNVHTSLDRGAGMWYYDLPCEFDARPIRRAVGFWDTKALQEEIGKLLEVQKQTFAQPFRPAADLLVLFSAESFYYTAPNGTLDPISTRLIDDLASALYKSGVKFDMQDVMATERIDAAAYRTVVFANTFYVPGPLAAKLREKFFGGGRQLIFYYAPAILDERSCDPQNCERFAGVAAHPEAPPVLRQFPEYTVRFFPVWSEESVGQFVNAAAD
jgi:hypothetical protein